MCMESTRAGRRLGWRLLALTLFAAAMAHLEAVVVVYIRHILGIVPTPEHLDRAVFAQVPHWLLATERGREAATIVMLVTLALLVGRKPLEKLAVFLFTFALWDIFYYVSLKVQIGWPASLQTTDLLFLIPVPWFAPVWLPLSMASVMVAVALFLFAREHNR